MKNNEKQLQQRLKSRAKGRLRYSLEGGLALGGAMFIVTNLLDLNEHSFGALFLSLPALADLTITILFCTGFFATLRWWLNETEIHRLQQ